MTNNIKDMKQNLKFDNISFSFSSYNSNIYLKEVLSSIGLDYSKIGLLNNISINELNKKQIKYLYIFKNSITNELNTIIELLDNSDNSLSPSSDSSDKDIFSTTLSEHICNTDEYINTIIHMIRELKINI